MNGESKKHSTATIIITVLAVMIILVLAFLLYDYSIKPVPVAPVTSSVVIKTAPAPKIIPTNVINFLPPETLPVVKESGSCWETSIAASFRTDAFRCMIKNSIHDPCFQTAQKGFVFCQQNPLKTDSTLIKLTKPLPKPEVPQPAQENWAWFLTLKDGTYCSPFTGTRPFFGQGTSAQVANYGCSSNNPDQQVVLLGDITKGTVWTANEAILTKIDNNWTINSTQEVDIDTVWQ